MNLAVAGTRSTVAFLYCSNEWPENAVEISFIYNSINSNKTLRNKFSQGAARFVC